MNATREQCRSGESVCQPKSKREALYCLGTHSEMTRTEIAEAMGVSPSALGQWIDPMGKSRTPEDRLDHLLQLTDDNIVYARYIAHAQGFVVYDPKRDVNTSRMVREFADLLEAMDARADGTSVEDAERIEREGKELIGAVVKATEDAHRAAGSGGGKITVVK
jgi:DNA-binding transcriptional ArsR family regulator